MTRGKKILYIISALLTAILLCILFISGDSSKLIAAVLFIPITAAVCLLIKKRSILSIHKRQVLLLLSVIGLLYIMILYLSGIYFGFWRSSVPFSLSSLVKHILPIAVIIVLSEIVRGVLLAQKSLFASVCAYLSCILAELLCARSIGSIISFNQFMDLVGMTLFPAVSANLLYHYLSARYGVYPNIAFRLLITLYPYILPLVPAMPDALMAFVKLGVPLLIYLFIKVLYEKKSRYARHKKSKLLYVAAALAVVLAVGFVMLISCQFRFGLIVIGSESMTGEINKGDAIIYERYEDQIIKEGQVIIFDRDSTQVVHRVVEIERINGQNRYYTKGDANEDRDVGYVTDAQIVGITDFKIAYIGYPTIWMHDIFAV